MWIIIVTIEKEPEGFAHAANTGIWFGRFILAWDAEEPLDRNERLGDFFLCRRIRENEDGEQYIHWP